MNGTPAVGSIGFGVDAVSGRNRLPCPPTRTTAAVRSSPPVVSTTDLPHDRVGPA